MRQATPGYERTAAPREYSASSPPGPSVAIVAAICAAEILGLAGFSIVPALLPQFIEAWSLTNTQAGWLAGITSAGYMLVVIPLVSLTDRRPALRLTLNAGKHPGNQPARLAQFDDGNDCAILVQGDEGPAQGLPWRKPGSFGWGIGALHRLATATMVPSPRRLPHSISQSRPRRARFRDRFPPL